MYNKAYYDKNININEIIKNLNLLKNKYGDVFIAYKLGYRSSYPIRAWLRQKKIPNQQVNNVLRLIEELKE